MCSENGSISSLRGVSAALCSYPAAIDYSAVLLKVLCSQKTGINLVFCPLYAIFAVVLTLALVIGCCKNKAVMGTIDIVMVALVVALCVPHHHHADAVCFGDSDCKTEHNHAHQDDCRGEGENGMCPLVAQYVDTRSCQDEFDCSQENNCNYLLAYSIVAMLQACDSEADIAPAQPLGLLLSASRCATGRRGPPFVNS